MPVFGADPDPFYSADRINFMWEFWQNFPQRTRAGETPARVLWEAKSGCQERYQMFPGVDENPDD